MFRPRIIPVLLLKNQGLVKSVGFRNYRYLGDPINAVKIFNDLQADELVFLDILASKENRTISLEFVKNVGEEANMPFAVGGGINKIEQIRNIIGAGAERIIINTYATQNPDFIREAADVFGSSAIVVCIDVKKNIFKKEQVYILNGSEATNYSPVVFAQLMEEKGAGEIVIQSISKDGTMKGYDVDLVNRISKSVNIPVVALGGAGKFSDLQLVYEKGFSSGMAAGSMFVYHGKRNGILISYITSEEKNKLVR